MSETSVATDRVEALRASFRRWGFHPAVSDECLQAALAAADAASLPPVPEERLMAALKLIRLTDWSWPGGGSNKRILGQAGRLASMALGLAETLPDGWPGDEECEEAERARSLLRFPPEPVASDSPPMDRETQASAESGRKWRQGRKVPRNIYVGDEIAGQFQREDWARQAVEAVNGLPALRQERDCWRVQAERGVSLREAGLEAEHDDLKHLAEQRGDLLAEACHQLEECRAERDALAKQVEAQGALIEQMAAALKPFEWSYQTSSAALDAYRKHTRSRPMPSDAERDAIELPATSLASKYGFEDGDILNELLSRHGLLKGTRSGKQHLKYEHEVLARCVETFLMPLLPGITVTRIGTHHNPIRADNPAEVEHSEIAVRVPVADVLRIAAEVRPLYLGDNNAE